MHLLISYPGRQSLLLAAAFAVASLEAQPTPAATPAPPDAPGADTVRLSPFEVVSARDTGYVATNTLAGTRMNTALRDTPAAVSVFTKDFLEDIGAGNVTEAMQFSLNGGVNFTDLTGNGTQNNDLNIGLRGFGGALARNYFEWALSSDSYNVERLTFSRGPNSIIFGIGAPGGIINTDTKRALFNDVTELRFRVGSWDDYRGTLDINRPINRQLAVRLNLLYQDRNGWRDWEFMKRKGAALASTWKPFENTTVRFDGEIGEVQQLQALPWAAHDNYLPWARAGSPISATFGAAVPFTTANTSQALVFDPFASTGPLVWRNARVSQNGPATPGQAGPPPNIRDTALHPRRANLAGPGSTTDNDFYAWSVFVEQSLWDKVFLEAAYNQQTEWREWQRPLNWRQIAPTGDANAQLPNGQPNPNAGKLYVESNWRTDIRDNLAENLRFTAAYQLELGRLGSHRFAGMLSRRDVEGRGTAAVEANAAPNRAVANLLAAQNQIVRRTYIDLTSDDPRLRGHHDPRQYPINGQNGVIARQVQQSASDSLNRVDSKLVAVQSHWWNRRVVTTAGIRHDVQRNWGSSSFRDPVTTEVLGATRNASYSLFEGTTRTYGIVFHLNDRFSVYYNNADNFVPQRDTVLSDTNASQTSGNRAGEGQDAGLKFNLLGGRINGTIGWYETNDTNRFSSIDQAYHHNINALWLALGRNTVVGGGSTRATAGDGYEVEVTANLTPRWRLSLNYSIADASESDYYPHVEAYLNANRAAWQGLSPTTPLDRSLYPSAASTAGQAMTRLEELLVRDRAAEGQSARQHARHNGNVFTNYSFANSGRAKGWSIGGGINYRGPAVYGYDTTRNNAPLWGDDFFLVNVVLGHQMRLRDGKYRLQTQLNVYNLLNHQDLIPIDGDEGGQYRFRFQLPTRFTLSTTLRF